MTVSKRQEGRIYAIMLVLVIAVIFLIFHKYNSDMSLLQEAYISEQHLKTQTVVSRIERNYNDIYRGLRTIARLPSVRKLNYMSPELNSDSLSSIQELYNNLASTVSISEVYLTPAEFVPDKVNPFTGKLWEPPFMFDQLIVGRTKFSGSNSDLPTEQIEEIEIHEYRLIKQQIDSLRRKWRTHESFKGLNYPSISGEEVITCDNSHFDITKPNDKDRSGIVISVPYYQENGVFGGVVSGIILSNVLKSDLPSNYALINLSSNYVVSSDTEEALFLSEQWYLQGKPNPDFIYSEVLPLPIVEEDGEWLLWTGIPNEIFLMQSDVIGETEFLYLSIIITIIVGLLILLAIRIISQARWEAEHQNDLLESLVEELEYSRTQAENANIEKSRFLSNMSHELRTPMHAILGYTNLIKKKTNDDGISKYLDTIKTSGDRLTGLLNNLLDLAKLEAGKMLPHFVKSDLTSLLQSHINEVQSLCNDKALTIQFDETDQVTGIFDPILIGQVVTNLLSNAIKFSPRGEMIKINIGGGLENLNDRKQEVLEFTVKDQGIGIPELEIDMVFDKFVQSSKTRNGAGGTGLGLAICKEIIAEHHGKIWAVSPNEDKDMQSEDGLSIGTTFHVMIPAFQMIEKE